MTDHVRRGLVQALALSGLGLAFGIGTTGCAAPGAPRGRSYTETMTSVLLSVDGRHLVAIGSDHHYVFDVPEPFVQALKTPAVHEQVTGVFTPFHVDVQNDIRGEVTLRLAASASPDVEREAERLGFTREPGGAWELRSRLTGHRYAGWTYDVGLQRDRLNRTYTVEITTEETTTSKIVDDAATPIRVAADGVQLIYYAPLAPIIIPMIFLLKARDH